MNWNMIQLLAADVADVMSMADRVGLALRMLIVGLGMVFLVLAILWGVLALSRIVFYDMPRRRKEEEVKAAQSKSKPAPVDPASAPAPVIPAPAQSNDVLIAVITAAVSAAMAEEGSVPAGGFRVVSFRRSTGNHPWNRV